MSSLPPSSSARQYTNGFAANVSSDHTSNIDFNQWLRPNRNTSFVFKMRGSTTWGIEDGDILIIDRSLKARRGDIVLMQTDDGLKLCKWHAVHHCFADSGAVLHGVVRSHIHIWRS